MAQTRQLPAARLGYRLATLGNAALDQGGEAAGGASGTYHTKAACRPIEREAGLSRRRRVTTAAERPALRVAVKELLMQNGNSAAQLPYIRVVSAGCVVLAVAEISLVREAKPEELEKLDVHIRTAVSAWLNGRDL